MIIDIWSDIVCPWCYIGKRRFERALESFPQRDHVTVVYHAFQLYPTSPIGDARNHHDALMSKYGMSDAQATEAQKKMEQTAAGEGLEFHLVGGVTGNTFDAHRLVQLAQLRGVQGQIVERLFRAHFTEQRSIFDHASLQGLAVEAGLPSDEVRDVLASDRYADEVVADNEQARTLGANGVPFYVIDRRLGVSGAQPTAVFAEVLARAQQ
jgi:predicted DsbA family dithiol-disulfide isomerase